MKPVSLLLVVVGSLATALPWSASAQSTVIAGWDFSQYAVPAILSIDGATLTNTLDANHSDLDPTNASGLESNQFGTMHLDGQFGSTSTPLSFEGLDPFQPIAVPPNNSLTSNVDQVQLGFGSNAACIQGQIEQMPGANCSDFAMTALETVSVVFEADRSSAPQIAGAWVISFAGRTVTSGTNTIQVAVSTTGGGYTIGGTAQLTTVDTLFSFALGAPDADIVYVQLTLASPQDVYSQAAIDNVGISVPEPATGSAAAAALALGALSRRRARRS